jgi:3-dehydroquinate dehydratase
MPEFLLRVELINVPDDSRAVYQKLHEALSASNIYQSYAFTSGRHDLPDATYSCQSPAMNCGQVQKLASQIIEKVWKQHRIVVAEIAPGQICGYGLMLSKK